MMYDQMYDIYVVNYMHAMMHKFEIHESELAIGKTTDY
jgi:hypothetical protein